MTMPVRHAIMLAALNKSLVEKQSIYAYWSSHAHTFKDGEGG